MNANLLLQKRFTLSMMDGLRTGLCECCALIWTFWQWFADFQRSCERKINPEWGKQNPKNVGYITERSWVRIQVMKLEAQKSKIEREGGAYSLSLGHVATLANHRKKELSDGVRTGYDQVFQGKIPFKINNQPNENNQGFNSTGSFVSVPHGSHEDEALPLMWSFLESCGYTGCVFYSTLSW